MKKIQGKVVSVKNAKTAVILVESRWQHPLYKKYVKQSKKYACHYQDIKLELGDEVVIKETKPISKTKHFAVVAKVGKKS